MKSLKNSLLDKKIQFACLTGIISILLLHADPSTRCVINNRPDILPFYQSNGWDISESNWDNIIANWCSIDPSGCAYEKTKCASAGNVSSPCTRCVINNRPDILPFYQSNGWDVSESNWENILYNWCGIDPSGCAYEKTRCVDACNLTLPPNVMSVLTIISDNDIYNNPDKQANRNALSEPLKILTMDEARLLMNEIRSLNRTVDLVNSLINIDATVGNSAALKNSWVAILSGGTLDYAVEILTYTLFRQEAGRTDCAENTVTLHDYGTVPISTLIHESHHSFNFTHGLSGVNGLNEGTAITVIDYYDNSKDRRALKNLAESVFGTVLYYRDIGLTGYPRDIPIGDASVYDTKGRHFLQFLMSQDQSSIHWFDSADVVNSFTTYWKLLNRNVAWEEWLQQVENATRKNGTIFKWLGGTNWSASTGGTAVRISAASNGDIWVVNSSGMLWRWNGSTWGEPVRDGNTQDVGCGADGSVVITTNNVNADGGQILKLSGNTWMEIGTGGRAKRVDVDSYGNVWVVNGKGDVWKWNGSWTRWRRADAQDIGCGSGKILVTLKNENDDGGRIMKFNGKGWSLLDRDGRAANLDIANDGSVWAINNKGMVWKFNGRWTQVKASGGLDVGCCPVQSAIWITTK